MIITNVRTRKEVLKTLFVIVAMAVAGAGCATSNYNFEKGGRSPATVDGSTLAAGDDLDIKFYYSPELNESQTIRPDGKISLQLIGDVQAAGQTPGTLEKALENKFHGLIEKNEITVIARRFAHRVVYVGGAVNRPQGVPMPGNMTVLAAIMSAGGEDPQSAAMGQVVVLREETGKYRGYALDLAGTLQGKNQEPFYLRPGDIVYVTRTRISDMDRWVDQHINQLVPRIGFSVLTTSGGTTVGYDTAR